jgi:hypothetical protein
LSRDYADAVTLHQSNSNAINSSCRVASVAIPVESHKTRLLESKMEILRLLAGRRRYLENTCRLLAIFEALKRPLARQALTNERSCSL